MPDLVPLAHLINYFTDIYVYHQDGMARMPHGLLEDSLDNQDRPPMRPRHPCSRWCCQRKTSEENVFGAPAGVAGSVAVGYQVMLDLPEGEHVITISDPAITVTYQLTVAEPQIAEPDATPAT